MNARKLVRMMWIVVLIAAVYAGFVVWSRWHERRLADEEEQQRVRENARRIVDIYGGDKLTILHFYSTESIVPAGESTNLCYGVSNAAAVRIEPTVADVWPSISRCVQVKPKQSTKYKLVATDKGGHDEAATVEVRVK